MMKTLKFKSNINCGSCVNNVTPALNAQNDIEKWEVDIKDPRKILTVTTNLDEKAVQSIVESAGYKAEILKEA